MKNAGEEFECGCRPPVSGEPHYHKSGPWNTEEACWQDHPVSGEPSTARQRYLQALMDEHDAYDWEQSGELDSWLKLADDIEAEARLSMHVHHWGDDGKCMYPRCDFVAEASTGAALDVLRPYLKHHGTCRPDGISILHDGTVIPPCECGLDAILARLAEQEGDR